VHNKNLEFLKLKV